MSTTFASPANRVLTNLAHLDWLCAPVTPAAQPGHTTYRLDREPVVTAPWTYAEQCPDGSYRRVGGGRYDPETDRYGQGAFNADDVARVAVVYLRHWRATGAGTSRESAYQVLRALTFLQTASGPDAGNVVLWMQPDGTLSPSADPPEEPDPSDGAESYWLARTVWALGEGYRAFHDDDPEFAAFLRVRLGLAVAAIERQTLIRDGEWIRVDGATTPAWLISDGADATGEALLGLAAFVEASGDPAARTVLDRLTAAVAAMGADVSPADAGPTRSWPYGAVLPFARSPAGWHAWGGLAPAGLAQAYAVNGDTAARDAALADAAEFTPHLLIAVGPANAWSPAGTDETQIAYGAHSRVESLLSAAARLDRPELAVLAGIAAAWFFGANPAGEPVYDEATGRTFDGVDPPGVIHHDSGAESTIHGLLAMLALDANPTAAAVARTASVRERCPWSPDAAGPAAPAPTPELEWLTLARPGTPHGTALVKSFAAEDRRAAIAVPGDGPAVVSACDRTGRAIARYSVTGPAPTVVAPPGGFVIVRR